MQLSAPIYRLKRQARLLSRRDAIPLHEALDRMARKEGYESWSLLARRAAANSPSKALIAGLEPGELVLLGARPGQGKTLLSLEMAIEAMKAGQHGAFFTLEYSEADIIDRFADIGERLDSFGDSFVFYDSDDINANFIIDRLQASPPGTLVVIDYLQALDQKRENPSLMEQVKALRAFAQARGLILVFVSQIHRRFDAAERPFPALVDVRLPNPLDLKLFDKSCFLNDGEISFAAVG